MTQLVITYFVLAGVALMVAVGSFALAFQHSTAAGAEETLQLHITQYHG